MSEFDKLSFDPMVPLGGTPSEPTPPMPSFNRTELLLPPLPKPTVPVEPRSAMPTLKTTDTAAPAVTMPNETPSEPAKPPVPGRMAWVSDAMRQLVRPTRSKGIMAAGLGSLAAAVALTQWLSPKPAAPKAEPVAVAQVEFVPPTHSETPAAPVLKIDPPAPVMPPPVMPATDLPVPGAVAPPLPLLNLKVDPPMDPAVKHAGGVETPVIPPVTPPVTPPTAPPLVAAPPVTAPTASPPTVTLPTMPAAPSAPGASGVIVPPTPTLTAPVMPTTPAGVPTTPPKIDVAPGVPGLGALPTPKIEETKPEPPKIPDMPKVEIAQPPAMPDLKAAPKIEPKAVELPKIESDIPKTPLPGTPPAVKDDFGPIGGAPKTPQNLPKVDAVAEPRTIVPGITATASPAAPKATAVPPKQDFDVDVHYATANDTYASICKKHLEDDRYADALRAYNGNRAIVTGQPVDVPPLHVLRKQYAQFIPGSKAVMPPAGEVIPASRSTGGLKSYDIPAGGMTLKALAKTALGDENLWGQIWELNPRLKADDPVPAGTRIRLPGDSRLGE